MNILNCFNGQGHPMARLICAEYFGKMANVYELEFDSDCKIDCAKITNENICDIFSLNCDEYECFSSHYLTSDKEDACDDDCEIYRNGGLVSTSVNILDKINKLYYEVCTRKIVVYYTDHSFDEIDKLCEELVKKLPKKEEKPKSAEVGLVAYDQGYYTIKSKIDKVDINISDNYNDDFLPVYNDIVKFMNERESGLIVLRGIRGSGKTTVIRHLCSSYPHKYIIVTNSIAQRLAEPDFMSYMLDNKDSIFILEDCEQILMDRSENTFGGAISNILNMADGLMSDIFNVKFICTFNADINKIDSALLRKGRCYANYEFKPLCKEKTKSLLKKRGVNIDDYDDVTEMTLAEIYNYEVANYDTSEKPRKKIGF